MTENLNEVSFPDPKYTKGWLGLQIVYAFCIAGILTILTLGISSLAGNRMEAGLLNENHFNLIGESANYCFAIIGITLMSITLIELVFRKGANLVQFILIGCSLCLFYLLLLSVAEHIPFWAAYLIVSAMTIGLIAWFMNAIVKNRKASIAITGILTVEYGAILLLVYLGSMVLLVGSVLLFLLIGMAMYLTLRLRVEGEELVLK